MTWRAAFARPYRLDPIASNPDTITIIFNTSEPVQPPTVTITVWRRRSKPVIAHTE